MTIVIVGGVCILAVIVLAATWAFLPHGDPHTSRPARRGPATWAREQRARAGKAARVVRRDLASEDRITLDVIGQMRAEDTGGLIALPTQTHDGGQVVLRTRTPQGPLLRESVGGAGSTPALAAVVPAPPAGPVSAPPDPGITGPPGPAVPDESPGSGPAAGLGATPHADGVEPVPAPAALADAVAAVRAASITTYLGELARVTAYDHSDATDSFAAIAAGWV